MKKKNNLVSIEALEYAKKISENRCSNNIRTIKDTSDYCLNNLNNDSSLTDLFSSIQLIIEAARKLQVEYNCVSFLQNINFSQNLIDEEKKQKVSKEQACSMPRTNIVDEVKKYAKMKTYCGCIGIQSTSGHKQIFINDLVGALKSSKRINQYAFKYRDWIVKPQEMFLVQGKVGKTPIKSVKELFDIIAKKDKKTMVVIKGEINVAKQK